MTQQINRRFIEYFLKINGVRIDAPPREIRAILERARWSSADIELALRVCTDACGQDTEVSGRTFRPDVEWTSAELSDLLGVRVEVTPSDRARHSRKDATTWHLAFHILLCVCTAAVAAVLVFVALTYLS